MDRGSGGIHILIVDDHPIFRDALRVLLETEPGLCVVGEAADGAEAVKLARQLKPDILLLDLAMPRHSGLQALRDLDSQPCPVRTIILAAAIEKAQIVEAFQLGARGVLLKESTTRLLFKSIRSVMAGEYWLGRESFSGMAGALRHLLSPPGAEPRRKVFNLTPRELEIIAAVVAGHRNKNIAQNFSLSEETVKHHLRNIFDKVGVSNRLELALFAVSHGLAGGGEVGRPENVPL